MRLAGLLIFATLGVAHAAAESPGEFAWRGRLDLPPQATLVRVALPADALMRSRSPAGGDVRVFDAQGRAVPFAFTAPPEQPAPLRDLTPVLRALPLSTLQPPARTRQGAVEVRIDQGGGRRSVWVEAPMPGAAPERGARLPAVLFDARASREAIDALVLDARVPANAPVRFTLAWSQDLSTWTPVPLRGRIYRFDAEGTPANDRLELLQPLSLEGRWLKLDWTGQDGVAVQSARGVVVPSVRAPAQVSAAFPAGRAADERHIDWDLPSAWPLAELDLVPAQPNTLVPVRVLGRSTPSERWGVLGQGVVHRVSGPDGVGTNPPLKLARRAVKHLRVETTYAGAAADLGLQARAVFDRIEVVFLAGSAGPYELATGLEGLQPAALPLATLAASTRVPLAQLPEARITEVVQAPQRTAPAWLASIAPGLDAKSATLWAVLLAGVAMLAAVAWSLVRQLRQPPG